MLKFMRKKQKSIVVWVIFIIIIIVFVFWGVGSFRIDKSAIAAKVNGKIISANEFTKVYQRQIEYYKKNLKDQFSDEMLEKMNLKQRTLDGLINRAIILEEAKKQGIKIEEKDLQKTIAGIPAFQKNGAFDNETYLQILSGMRMLPGEFEKAMEEEMILEKVQKNIAGNVSVNDKDALDIFKTENKRINLQYAAISSSQFEKGILVADDEASGYFEKNKDNLKIPDKVKAAYAALTISSAKQDIKISDDDIKTYYEKNIKAFERQKEVKARHILFRTQKSKEEAKKKAGDVLNRIKKGEDFAELAKKYSEDPGSVKNGGDLGYFKAGMMVKPFEDAAFAMKSGGVSEVIETDFGFHIIKVEDVKEAGLQPLNDAKKQIADLLGTAKAVEKAKETAQSIRKEIDSGKGLKEAAAKNGVKIKETGYFSQSDRGNEIVMNEELNKAVFSLKKNETSQALDGKDGYYIIQVIDRIDSHVPSYKEVSEGVKNIILKQKALEKSKLAADEFLKNVKQGKDFSKSAEANKYKIDETGFFTAEEGIIPKTNISLYDNNLIFSLTKELPYYEKVVPSHGMFYVLKLKDALEANEKEFEAKKETIKMRLLEQKKGEAFEKWLNETRAKAKIEINKEAM